MPEVLQAAPGIDLLDQRSFSYLDARELSPYTGAGVNVYILDTGIQEEHSAFRFADVELIRDYATDSTSEDCSGHGTSVASTVVGITATEKMGSAIGASVRMIRMISCESQNSQFENADTYADAFEWLTTNIQLPAVIVLSKYWTVPTNFSGLKHHLERMEAAAGQLHNQGAIVVVAAGNSGQDVSQLALARLDFPVVVGGYMVRNGIPTRLSIGATVSGYGETIDLWAPGETQAADLDGGFTYGTGTSYAAPITAGVIARFIEARRNVLSSIPANQRADFIVDELLRHATRRTVANVPSGTNNMILFGFEPEWLPQPGPLVHVIPEGGLIVRDDSDGALIHAKNGSGTIDVRLMSGSTSKLIKRLAPGDFRSDFIGVLLTDIDAYGGKIHIGGSATLPGSSFFSRKYAFRSIVSRTGIVENTAIVGPSDILDKRPLISDGFIVQRAQLQSGGLSQFVITRVNVRGDAIETHYWTPPEGAEILDIATPRGETNRVFLVACGSIPGQAGTPNAGSLDAFVATFRIPPPPMPRQLQVNIEQWGTPDDDWASYCRSRDSITVVAGTWNEGEICLPPTYDYCTPQRYGFIQQFESAGLSVTNSLFTSNPVHNLAITDWTEFSGFLLQDSSLSRFVRGAITWTEDTPVPMRAISVQNGVGNLVPTSESWVRRVRLHRGPISQ